ncbi:MAG: hypothetical protein EBS49_04680 [Verrucomicrobia bacterium]|nr:hypothetical protein [Verrucomicrobiota bacterium]
MTSSAATSPASPPPFTPWRETSTANSRNRNRVCSGVRGTAPLRKSGWARLRRQAPSTSGVSGQKFPGHPTVTHSCNRTRFSAATARETRREANNLLRSLVSLSPPKLPCRDHAWIPRSEASSNPAAFAATRSRTPSSPGLALPVQPSASQR